MTPDALFWPSAPQARQAVLRLALHSPEPQGWTVRAYKRPCTWPHHEQRHPCLLSVARRLRKAADRYHQREALVSSWGGPCLLYCELCRDWHDT